MSPSTPTKIGKYDVLDVIGRGGMGVVYKGNDPYLDRLVAIKMMTGNFTDNPDQMKRFFREAQSTGSLQHPNIVTVYELGDHHGSPYLVMEYLEGEGLDSIISARRPLHLLEKLSLIVGVCRGLTYAHRRGIVHRDIKPANIMVLKDGGVKIVDFGIAHIGDKSVTRTGQIMGSLSYMSPEQVNGKTVDIRTDLFSTGVVLYQLVTYSLPFDGDSTAATLLRILHEPAPPLKNFLAAYPPELEAILQKALAKERENRYQSADALALDITQLQAQLKQEIVSRRMQEAAVLVERAELHKAKEKLLKVLELDQHHTQANRMIREVQEKIQRQQLDEQIRQLRAQADEACSREQFDAALSFLDRALMLDKENAELQRQRAAVQSASIRLQKLQSALKRAESAHHDLDLDGAKQAVEEALAIAPEDAHAKALYRAVQRDWAERSRQRQIETYLENARKEIASRRFTSALEVLKQAEALDPSALQVRALMETASAGQEQERRRRELEAITHEIEDALNRDDYVAACQKAEEGLQRFPEDRSLLKLRALAEKQRQNAERKQLVDEHLANARKLLEEGRSEELLQVLEGARAKLGNEPRLESLLLIVRENVQRERNERRKVEHLRQAKEALRRKAYDEAIRILVTAQSELQDAGEVDDLLQFAREEQTAEKRRQAVEETAAQAHTLLGQQSYERAIRLLESAMREYPDEELRLILAEAREAAQEFQKKLEVTRAAADRLVQSRRPTEAIRLVEGQPSILAGSPELQILLQSARKEAERLRNIDLAIEKSKERLQQEDYVAARKVLEECRRIHGVSPELEGQAAAVQEQYAQASARTVEKAISDARMLSAAGEYEAAREKLAAASSAASSVPPGLRAEYEGLQQQAVLGLARQRKLRIEQCIGSGDFTRAAELLRQATAEFPDNRDLLDLKSILQQETARRAEAQQALVEAEDLFRRTAWKPGGEWLKKAFLAAQRAPALRQRALEGFMEAAERAVESDWRASEALLAQLTELQPAFPEPALLRARIAERKRAEFIAHVSAQTKRLQAAGDLRTALAEVTRGLATYPDDHHLQQLKSATQALIRQEEERIAREKARIEKEAFVRETVQRSEKETQLDRRVQVLEQALGRYPEETNLRHLLVETRNLLKRVSEYVNAARVHEEAQRYDECLQQWNALKQVYARYPDLDRNIERVARLRERARSAAKASALQNILSALISGDYGRAGSLLVEAKGEFPGERELADLERKLQDALKLRAKAQKPLADARKAFGKQQWERGVEYVRRGCEMASQDVAIRDEARTLLLDAADSALPTDLAATEMLFAQASSLQPSSALLIPLKTRIEGRKRQQAIEQRHTAVMRTVAANDLQGATQQIEQALATYPEEPRFVQLKKRVEAQIAEVEEQRKREEESRRIREQERQRELERQREIERQRQEEARRREQLARDAEETRKREEAARLQEETRRREEQLRLDRERERQRQEETQKREQLDRERRAEEERRNAEQERLQQEALRSAREVHHERDAEPKADLQRRKKEITRPFGQTEPDFPLKHLSSVDDRVSADPLRQQETGELRVGELAAHTEPSQHGSAAPVKPEPPGAPAARVEDQSATQLLKHDVPARPGSKTEARTMTSLNIVGWQPEILHAIEKELAVFIGPLARIIVKKNAQKTTDPEQLYLLLAASLEKEHERQAFVARKAELSKNWPKSAAPPEVTQVSGSLTSAIPLMPELTPEAIDRAIRLMAPHVGPISGVLVKKEARKADSLRALYLRLAEHVENPAERARFLRDAGF